MSRELNLYGGAGDGLAPSGHTGAGGATSVDDMEFAAPAASPLELPSRFLGASVQAPALPLAADATASGVVQLPRPEVFGDDRYLVREFWHAWADQVVFTRALRSLRGRADGRLHPDGDWLVADRLSYRVGAIPAQKARLVDDTLTDTTRSTEGTGVLAGRFEQGAFAQSALPRKVRLWLNQKVPSPGRWTGSVLRWSDDSETIDLLRGDDTCIAVVKARRTIGSPTWDLVRRAYTITATPVRFGALPSRPQSSGRRELDDSRTGQHGIGRR